MRVAVDGAPVTHSIVVPGATMLSMPLAYPSTLDRRPEKSTSYVEGSWSPMRSVVTQNRRVTATRSYTREIQRQTKADLSLSSGASSGVGVFQAEHHLLVE
jgi:hypothetical protein